MATTFSLVVIFVPVSFMSSISGRFLYQFGITAAVSVLVSLLVSFTLTPMMCARLLRTEDAAAGGEPRGRRGRAREARLAHRLLRLDRPRLHLERWRWPCGTAGSSSSSAWLTLVSAVPIYRQVKQEYIPSDVDESEFEVLVFGPEGMSLAAMDEAMQALAARGPGHAGRRAHAGLGRRRLPDPGQPGLHVRAHGAPRGAHGRRSSAFWDGLIHGRAAGALPRQLHASATSCMELRRRFRKFTRPAHAGAQHRRLQHRRRHLRHRPRAARPRAGEAGRVRRPTLKAKAQRARRHRGRRHHAAARQAGAARGRSIAQRAADLRVDTQQIATALRLMVGGDDQVSRFHDPIVNDDYDVQIRLMPPFRGEPRARSRACTSRATRPRRNAATGARGPGGLAPGGGLVRLDNLVQDRAAADRVAHRPHRPAARDAAARPGRAGLRPGRSHRCAQEAGDRDEPAGRPTRRS